MTADPQEAQPGELVELRFPQETFRGVAWDMTRWEDDDWSDPLYLLVSDPESHTCGGRGPEVGDPSRSGCAEWFPAGEGGYDDVRVSGPGPDVVQIPEVAEPGVYRLCTANSGEDVACVQVAVVDE